MIDIYNLLCEMSSSTNADNRIKEILILGQGLTVQLDDTAINLEAKYSVNITKSRKKICLTLHYNTAISFLYAYGVKVYQLKLKDSKIKLYSLCLGTISKDVTIDNMEKLD